MEDKEYTPEELKTLSDLAIKELFLKIRSKILLLKNNIDQQKELEIYYCYVSKELEDRSKR